MLRSALVVGFVLLALASAPCARAQATEECFVPNPVPMYWSLTSSTCTLSNSLGQCANYIYVHPDGATCGWVNALCRDSGRWGWLPSSGVQWSTCRPALEKPTVEEQPPALILEENGHEDKESPGKAKYQCPSGGNHALTMAASLRRTCQDVQINGLNRGDVVRVDSCDGVCCNVWAYRVNQGGYVYCWAFF